jgi:hypothetical protein
MRQKKQDDVVCTVKALRHLTRRELVPAGSK